MQRVQPREAGHRPIILIVLQFQIVGLVEITDREGFEGVCLRVEVLPPATSPRVPGCVCVGGGMCACRGGDRQPLT